MIDFIIGDIVEIEEDYFLIENNGIGYKIFSSSNTMLELKINERHKVFTQIFLREDGVFLYGFSTKEEMEMFNLLLKVSKIGPRIGIGVLSTLRTNQIKLAIFKKDINTLCKAPGIGKKTAERIILELKDKIGDEILLESDEVSIFEDDNFQEAVGGLMTLGYSKFEIERIIRSMDIRDMDVEDIIREVLKKISRK